MGHRSAFRLEKWYLDAVADDGTTEIGYAARLAMGPLALTLASRLSCAPGEPPRTRTHLVGASLPRLVGRTVTWRCPRGPAGTWTARQLGGEHVLLDGREGALRWSCLFPAAAVELGRPGEPPLAALGYVERLDLTLPPWRLPLRELRWGRFVAPTTSMVWIEWRGPQPLTLVLRDGQPASDARVGDDGVSAVGAQLAWCPGEVLRDGELGTTVLRAVPVLRRALPAALLGTHETKWRRRGTLTGPQGARAEGWVIHELVTFPPP